jgi:predicted transcriptional regulator
MNLTIQLSSEEADALRALADDRDLTPEVLAQRAIKEFIAEARRRIDWESPRAGGV